MRLTSVRKVTTLVATIIVAALESSAQTAAPSLSANLAPIAFLTAHEWDAQLPDTPDGKKRKIHAQFTSAPSGQAMRITNQMITDGKASPYIDGLYAWDPQEHTILFWYVGAEGSLTRGTVKSEGGKLVHDFEQIDPNGRAERYVAHVTPHGDQAWENEIFARKENGLTPLVKVHYELAK